MPRRYGSAGGLTLLELLVAVAVLGVAVVTLLGLQARNVRLAAETRDLTIAGLLASSLAAEAMSGPFPEEGSAAGTFSADDSATGDLQQEYGGATAAGRFAWRRTVEWLGFKNVRLVRIDVTLVDDDRPLATMEFLVRKPARQAKGS
jgi:prepilin-type N-terminal cleavage/methylation domain-containing protein